MPLRQLYPPDPQSPASKRAKVDIVAVHGLNPRSKKDDEHAWNTWRAPAGPNGRLWLRDDLPQHMADARICLFEYNSTAAYGKDQNSFVGKANELLEDVHVAREAVEARRPILLVGHSMGGLLIKQALVNAAQNAKYLPIRDATTGIVFFATPHNGGERKRVRLGSAVTRIATTFGLQKGDDVLETLKSGSVFSGIMREQWRHQVGRYKIVSFWGGLDTVVPVESAHLGLSSDHERLVKLNADHRTVCKFGTSQVDRDNFALVQSNIQYLFQDALRVYEKGRLQTLTEGFTSMTLTAETGAPAPSGQPQYYIPLSKNRRCVERKALLDALKQTFFDQGCQAAALVGLGGIGKTQVALQFAYWAKDSLPGHSVFWVPALSRASFDTAYAEIARVLRLQIPAGDDPKAAVKRHLDSTAAGPWLLIVDNADDKDILFGAADRAGGISDYLPNSDDGFLLYTTRSREVATAVARRDVVHVDEMNATEATALLTALVQDDLNADTAARNELLEELTYLPLAITQAAAYMTTAEVSVPRYLELFRRPRQDKIVLLSRTFRDNTRYNETQHPVSTTWLVSFDRLREDGANGHAAQLLEFISCIEPKAIPRSILPEAETEEEMEFALSTLCGYAFLSRRDDDQTFDMHSLVHLATEVWVEHCGRTAQARSDAVEQLNDVYPGDDMESRFLWQEYLPHASRLLRLSPDSPERFQLLYWVGRCLLEGGRTRESIRCLEQVYESRRRLPEDNFSRLSTQHLLGMAYTSNGRLSEAVDLLKKTYDVRVRILPEDHINRLATQDRLAAAYLSTGQVAEAIELLRHAVKVRETRDEDHPHRLISQSELASAYLVNGQVEEAIQMLEHLARVREALPEDHPQRLFTQQELGKAYLRTGRTETAVQLLEHVVRAMEGVARDHPRRLVSQYELAMAYLQIGRSGDAIQLLEHIVRVREAHGDQDGGWLVRWRYALANAYHAAGRVDLAVHVLEKPLPSVVPPDDPRRRWTEETLERYRGELRKLRAQDG